MVRNAVLPALCSLVCLCACGDRPAGSGVSVELRHWEVARAHSPAETLTWTPYRVGADLRGPEPGDYLFLRTMVPDLKDIANPVLHLSRLQHLLTVSVRGERIATFAELDAPSGELRLTRAIPLVPLPPDGGGAELVLTVYGGHSHPIALEGVPLIGDATSMTGRFFLSLLPSFILGALFVTLGLCALGLFAFGRNPLIPPFSLFSICVGLFALLQNEFTYPFWGEKTFLFAASQMALFLVPVGLALFVERLVPGRYARATRYARWWHLLYAGGAFVGTLAGFPSWIINQAFNYATIPTALLLTGITIFQLFSRLPSSAGASARTEVKILAAGFAVIWLGGLHDIAAALAINLLGTNIFPFATLLFIICLGAIIARRFFENQRSLEIYAHDLKRTRDSYARFVPREFLTYLGKADIVDVELGDRIQRNMAVLFADIRAFTTLSESMTPEENFAFVNAYLGRVGPLIRRHGGFIDKYIGDAVMALFEKPADAVLAALDMLTEVSRYNDARRAAGFVELRIGAGIHAGPLVLGTVGERERMQGTVIADAVNLASRLEGLTKEFGASLVVSEAVIGGLEDPTLFEYRFLSREKVKGKSNPVSVFEILDGLAPAERSLKSATRAGFERAVLQFYEGEFSAARAGLTALRERGADPAVEHYLRQLRLAQQ